MKFLFNENVYIKHQMSILFSILIILSFGITLSICLGFLYGLGDNSQTTTENRILEQSYDNAQIDAIEIASAIERILITTAETTSLATAYYSSLLLQSNYISQNKYRFPVYRTFKEYNFIDGCKTNQLCPDDYGQLNDRSRVPNLNGSIESTSLYIYSSTKQKGIKTDNEWDQILSSDDLLNYTLNSISYQDPTFQTTYNYADDVMFLYLSIQINSGLDYKVLHRVYPGTIRNGSTYNPSTRPWFTHAPEDSITVQGPYVETFTKKNVLNLSSRKVISSRTISGRSSSNTESITVVGATVMLLDTISNIIKNMKYPNNGFGVLLRYSTLEVIVWGDNTNIYNPIEERFLTLYDFDPNFPLNKLYSSKSFQHNDPNGTKWVISSVPFMYVEDYQTFGSSQYAFILLVYSKWSDASQSIPVLEDNIQHTENNVTLIISIITIAIVVFLLIYINLFVNWLTQPLQIILDISSDIMKMSSEEEKNKNYLPFVDQGIQRISTRTDEIGLLSSIYWQMLWKLHQDNLKKKSTPKYPPNPFYSENLKNHSLYGSYLVDSKDLSPSLFLSLNDLIINIPKEINEKDNNNHYNEMNLPSAPDMNEVGIELASKDALSRLGYQLTLGQDIEAGNIQNNNQNHNQNNKTYQIIPINNNKEKSDENENIQNSYPGRILEKTTFTLGFYLAGIGTLIFAGLCVIVIITIIYLRSESYSWMDETGQSLTNQQISNMYTITEAKSKFSKSYFDQININTQVIARQFTSLLDKYQTTNSLSSNNFLTSYSNDPQNYYKYPSSNSYDISGYFHPDDAKCQSQSVCSTYRFDYWTEMTSLFDTQSKSLFYPDSTVSFVQFGLESSGFSRTYPYAYTTYGQPTQCLISTTTNPICYQKYQNSICSNFGTLPYPAYDSRCRSWYSFGVNSNSLPLLTYFQEPRKASNGQYVITSITKLQSSTTSNFYGVINLNVLANDLSNSVNNFKILKSGYVYILDQSNITKIILHPRATSTCSTLKCCEKGFNENEYNKFLSILSQLSSSTSKDIEYQKDGKKWLLVNSGFQTANTIDYLVIATVPFDEILEPSNDVEKSIDSVVVAIIIVAVIVLFILLLIIIYCIHKIIQAIQKPVFHIIKLCQNIISNDLHSSNLQDEILCRDMKILLEAFKNILIALRFGNDAYISGNMNKALEVYTDALHLFEALSNEKGISSCYNNLGGIYLTVKQYHESEEYYQKSIEMATKQVNKLVHLIESNTSNIDELKKNLKSYQQILSDRQSNYSLLKVEQKNYSEAFQMLESCLQNDLQNGYINGCVNKQGSMGHLYLRQGEIKSAEKQFLNSLLFLDNTIHQEKLISSQWNETEVNISKQIALFNYGKLYEEKKDYITALHYFIMSVQYSPNMHSATMIKSLSKIFELYTQKEIGISTAELEILKSYCLKQNLNIAGFSDDGNSANVSFCKRIALALDYSGSMSGVKITSAIENILYLFENFVQSSDKLLLLHFNSLITVDIPLTIKNGNEEMMKRQIQQLTKPFNSTYLYDAINYCIEELHKNNNNGDKPVEENDWIIVITDGEDTGSQNSVDKIKTKFSEGRFGVIIIGIGEDVSVQLLEGLAQSCRKGYYLHANSNKESITKVFGTVRTLLQENIVFEDM